MRDKKYRRGAFQLVDGLGKALGGVGVEGAGGFVEDQELRALENSAGDGEALFLAAGEADAVFADDGVVAVGKRTKKGAESISSAHAKVSDCE